MARFLIDTFLRWVESKQPTSLMRLSDITQVTVLLDADEPSVDEAVHVVKNYFAAKGIQLVLVNARSGRIVKAYRESQVLISLVPWKSLFLEYAVRHSRAVFKIGRSQLPGEPFDLVVSNPEGTNYPQAVVFGRMMELLESLK